MPLLNISLLRKTRWLSIKYPIFFFQVIFINVPFLFTIILSLFLVLPGKQKQFSKKK